MIGVVTVGVCGAVLTYVSIVLLTAYYMNDTSQIERQMAVEAPGSTRETVKAKAIEHLDGTAPGTIPIERAMQLIVLDAAKDPSNLVPGVGPSTAATVIAEYGRPVDVASKPAEPVKAPEPVTPTPTTPEQPAQPGAGTGTGTGTGAPPAPGANGN
jgi:hypothetical protein